MLPIAWIPNGVDPETPTARSPSRFPELPLAYLGLLNGNRNMDLVIAAFRRMLDSYPEVARSGSKLRVAGHSDAAHAHRLQESVVELGLGEHLEVQARLSQAATFAILHGSRVAFVLAQDQDLQVPAKPYECAVSGVTTVVTASPESAGGREPVGSGCPWSTPPTWTDCSTCWSRSGSAGVARRQ
jgi:glycosyltransferase involved in cell wall biosynthesis